MSEIKLTNPADSHRQSVEECPHYTVSGGQYQLRNDGVYFVAPVKGADAEDQQGNETKVCGYLKVECRFRDFESNTWGRVLRWLDHDGREHHWNLSDKTLSEEPSRVRGILADQGLWMAPCNVRSKDRVIEYISAAEPRERAICTDRLGWLELADGTSVFVLPKETISKNKTQKVLYVPPSREVPEIESKGSLEAWIERVAKPALHSSRAVLCICAVLAAPLLRLTNRENVGFHLRGNSSSGKSMALMIGSSVLGSPKLKKVWRATSNGLEGQALQHNDVVLQLDEIGQANGKEVGKCIYDLMNGAQKARANIYGLARKVNKWRLITLSSGEVGLREMAAENRVKVYAGQEIRLIDIPADAGHKLGVNESLPEGTDTIQEYAKQIKQACSENYGTAFHAWIEHLVAQPPVSEDIQTELTAIVAKLVPEKSSAQVKRVAESFALLIYAGEEASKLRITGWPEGTAVSCIKRCFLAWLSAFGNSESREEDEIAEHVENLLLTQEARFVPLHPTQMGLSFQGTPANRLGWFDGEIYYVPSAVYRKEFCLNRYHTEVSRILLRRGMLIPGNDGKSSFTKRLPGLASAQRCYRLRLPKTVNEKKS